MEAHLLLQMAIAEKAGWMLDYVRFVFGLWTRKNKEDIIQQNTASNLTLDKMRGGKFSSLCFSE